MTLPISEFKLQELVAEAKDFVYALGKEIENILIVVYIMIIWYSLCCLFLYLIFWLNT